MDRVSIDRRNVEQAAARTVKRSCIQDLSHRCGHRRSRQGDVGYPMDSAIDQDKENDYVEEDHIGCRAGDHRHHDEPSRFRTTERLSLRVGLPGPRLRPQRGRVVTLQSTKAKERATLVRPSSWPRRQTSESENEISRENSPSCPWVGDDAGGPRSELFVRATARRRRRWVRVSILRAEGRRNPGLAQDLLLRRLSLRWNRKPS